MKLFLKFIKMNIVPLLLYVIFTVIFYVSFFFFRIPVKAVIYPSALCLFVGIITVIIRFINFSKKHKKMQMIKNIKNDYSFNLPESVTVSDEDYEKIINLLKDECLRLDSEYSKSYKDMVDYYTVWAHQIKTPIASMKLSLNNEDSQLSRKLSSELFRVEQYVEMVLAFLRLDAESTDYVFKKNSLDRMIKDSVKKFAPDFIVKKLKLDYESGDYFFVTDDKWFSFVLEQILSNAVKYTKTGGVKIFLPKPGILCIKDSGIGIAPGDLPRIFENGYTGTNGRADKSASGIGLYLCKRICDNLGIGISVESEIGAGTSVFLDLRQSENIKE